MFNDKYGLTEAVLDGRKTITRRLIKAPRTMEGKDVYGFSVVRNPQTKEVVEVMALDAEGAQINNILPKYKAGEVVAVAQSLRDMGYDPSKKDWSRGIIWGLEKTPGWTNKMFVCASDCVHHIRITNVRVERLQDISDKDCQREGITTMTEGRYEAGNGYGWDTTIDALKRETFFTPRAAFAALIDKVSGKGTWESNPWVFVYEFELL